MLTFRMQKKNRKKGGIIFNRKKNMGLWGTLVRFSRYDNVTQSAFAPARVTIRSHLT